MHSPRSSPRRQWARLFHSSGKQGQWKATRPCRQGLFFALQIVMLLKIIRELTKTSKVAIALAIFASMSIISTPTFASIRCVDLFAGSRQLRLGEDPFANFELAEGEVTRLTNEVTALYSDNVARNQLLDSVLQEAHLIQQSIARLQDRVLGDEVVSTVEFEAVLLRVSDLREQVRSNTDESTIADSPRASPQIVQNEINVSRRALKDVDALQPAYRRKYEEFIAEIALVDGLQSLSPRWSLGKVNMHEVTNGEGGYTARLNHGYRVLFQYSSAEGVTILRISKSLTHNN